MDRREVRNGDATLRADENIGKFPCYHVEVAPKDQDAAYKRVEIWIRKDNLVPLKWAMFDKSGSLAKTLVARELQKHDGRWQITRSVMVDHASGRSTEVLIERMDPRDVPQELFTASNIERH
jgi:hypothetical protein